MDFMEQQRISKKTEIRSVSNGLHGTTKKHSKKRTEIKSVSDGFHGARKKHCKKKKQKKGQKPDLLVLDFAEICPQMI